TRPCFPHYPQLLAPLPGRVRSTRRASSDRDGDQAAGRRRRAFVLLRDGRWCGGLRRLGLDGRSFRDLVAGDALDDRVDLLAVEGLLLKENLRDLLECGAVFDDDLL